MIDAKPVAQFISMFQERKDLERTSKRSFGESAIALSPWDQVPGFGFQNPSFLVQRKGIELIAEMRTDDALGAYVDIKKTGVLCSDHNIVAASDSPQHVEHKDFIEYSIRVMKGALREKIRSVLTAYDYGWSISNIPLRLVDDGGEFNGKIIIDNIKTKEQAHFFFQLDRFRNVEKILHIAPGAFRPVPLDPKDFLVFTHRQEYENPYGKSDMERAYRWWNSKKYVGRMWDMWLERFAGGFLDVEYPAGKQDDQEHGIIKKFIQNTSSPRTGLLHSDRYTVKLTEPTGRGSDSYVKAIQERNIYMARAVLLPDLLGYSSTPGGALALGKKHADIWLQVVLDHRGFIEEAMMDEQYIKTTIDLNYAGVTEYPHFEFEPMTEEQKAWWLTQVFTATEKGVLTKDAEIENRVRTILGLPERDPKEIEREEREKKEREEQERNRIQIEPRIGEDVPPKPGEVPKPGTPTDDNDPKPKTPEIPANAASFQEVRKTRAPTAFEGKVDFTNLVNTINAQESEFVSDWSDLLREQEKKLIAAVKSKKIVETKDTGAVDRLLLTRKGEQKKLLARFMLNGLYFGANEAQREVARGREKARMVGDQTYADIIYLESPVQCAHIPKNVPLDESEKFFKKLGLDVTPALRKAAVGLKREAFFITGVQNRKLLDQAKQVIYRGIRKSDLNWTITNLRKLFDGQIEQGLLPKGTKLGETYRAEGIARTQFNTAINEGRMVRFLDPDLDDFVVAFAYSAIIDDSTTAYCSAMDGRVFRKEEMRDKVPPAHHLCRALIIALTRGEKFEFSTVPSVIRGVGFEALMELRALARETEWEEVA